MSATNKRMSERTSDKPEEKDDSGQMLPNTSSKPATDKK